MSSAAAEDPFLALPFTNNTVVLAQTPRYTSPIKDSCGFSDLFRHCGGGFGVDYVLGNPDDSATWRSFPVVAAAAGHAVRSEGGGYGTFVLIKHDGFVDSQRRTYFTLYAHLENKSIPRAIPHRDRHNLEFERCDETVGCPPRVLAGQIIGEAGQTGLTDCKSDSCIHLHFEVFRGGYFQNPVDPYGISNDSQQFARDAYPPNEPCDQNRPSLWLQCPPGTPAASTIAVGTVAIDFNTLPDGTPTDNLSATHVGALYASFGVTFRSRDDEGPTFSHPLHPNSSRSIAINDFSRTQNGTFNIVADFTNPVTVVSADVLSAAGRTVRMTARDASGLILGSATSPAETAGAFPFKGSIELSGIGLIATVEWEASPDPDVAGVGIDNLMFASVVTPTFDFDQEFLAVDGNISGAGAPDGVVDFFDPFNDGKVTKPPTSELQCPLSVVEDGSFLHIRSGDGVSEPTPGAKLAQCQLGVRPGVGPLRDGQGNAIITASFRADEVEPGQAYGVRLVTGGSNEAVDIKVEGSAAGGGVISTATNVAGAEIARSTPVNLPPIQNVQFRLVFDDATNRVLPSFSLDEGKSFTNIELPPTARVMSAATETIVSIIGSSRVQ